MPSDDTLPRFSVITPLANDELESLADQLDAHAAVGLDELLGLLHAVAVAPGFVPLSAWLGVVLPNGTSMLREDVGERLLVLVIRLYGEVLARLGAGEVMNPDPSEATGCEAFARGYASGAELDAEWFGDERRWTFASWAAYLGGRLDLVPAPTRAIFAERGEDAKSDLRHEMAALVLGAHESFMKLRHASFARASSAVVLGSPGRNARCPCGSGKKVKRCCIDALARTAPR